MNELSMVFHKMDIDTKDVLAAAGTKWNFLPFTPGLVGGHCIGVDPYYLTYKAAECGHHAKTILVGREINDGMPKYIVSEIEDWSRNQGKNIDTLNVYGWGVTFKENVSDIRNAKIAEVYLLLQKKGVTLQVHDPHADAGDIQSEYGLPLQSELKDAQADILIVGVAHKDYTLLSEEAVASYVKQGGLIVDIKGLYNKEHFISKGYSYWRL
ncbi:MAG: hypothetical protein HOE53_01240 [Candidatus Magasanikbacteria bacterium]|nr:hypothetical protein [Candidatus Magasanikbacteria bacterium]